MKQIPGFIIIAVLFISSGPLNRVICQATNPIQATRQRYVIINKNLSKYKKVKKQLSGFSTEGGELVVYLEGLANIRKMVATYYGESGKAFEEYYYWDDQLIFVFRKDSRYDNPMSGKVVSARENRFYFSNGRLIKWINEKGKTVPTGDEFLTRQNDYLESSRDFTEGSRSAKSTIEARD